MRPVGDRADYRFDGYQDRQSPSWECAVQEKQVGSEARRLKDVHQNALRKSAKEL
jgi:hypothetical protein